MPFNCSVRVANPSPYVRSDYVEADLELLGVPATLDSQTLRLRRLWPGRPAQEVEFQIDYPFGREAGRRTLSFFSANTPPGDPDYKQPTAEFLLEEGRPGDVSAGSSRDLLRIEHYSAPGVCKTTWDPARPVTGVKLFNGGAPAKQDAVAYKGLQVYFSLVPRPEPESPFNYSGAALSILHHQHWRATGAAEFLAPLALQPPHAPRKCWGQLTRIDCYTLPWEQRWYQAESLLDRRGAEPGYTLAWSKAGPVRATVTLRSSPIQVLYGGAPFFQPDHRALTCYLYRVICLYPKKEFYIEQVTLRPEGEDVPAGLQISLAFRAHYYSFLDCPEAVELNLARLEDIPDYFALWRSFAEVHRGYAFASESHIRAIKVPQSEISWRLQISHAHRSVHFFPVHLWPAREFDRFNEVGHIAWYEQLYKPLQAIPFSRYLSP